MVPVLVRLGGLGHTLESNEASVTARAASNWLDARGYDGSQEAPIMVSKATARFSRISPRKARVIVDLVRGRQAGEALQILEFTTKSAAPIVKKLIESAVANARTASPAV